MDKVKLRIDGTDFWIPRDTQETSEIPEDAELCEHGVFGACPICLRDEFNDYEEDCW